MTGKLVGDSAALSFLQIGVTVVLSMSIVQILLFFLGKTRLIYRILFNIAFGCGIVWFMLCLILPVLWVEDMDGRAKLSLFLLLFFLCISNMIEAKKQFERKWLDGGEAVLLCCRDVKNSAIDWERVIEALKLSIRLYIPGVPRSMTPFISVVLILAMIIGLSVRNLFPMISLFAWGVPTCVAISILMQMIGLGFAQVAKVILLEKRYGACISSIS